MTDKELTDMIDKNTALVTEAANAMREYSNFMVRSQIIISVAVIAMIAVLHVMTMG